MIPDDAVEALARVLAQEALFAADAGGYGWDAETDSSDHFMPGARRKAIRYLEAAAPHLFDQFAELVEAQYPAPSADSLKMRNPYRKLADAV